ncbi:MAG: hypothetical protein QOE78_1520 [Alphaproteobacteria bacterium]|jgi:hypothetical protein|nr:hypothetical protein [Alphaproteobacteria bacterium]
MKMAGSYEPAMISKSGGRYAGWTGDGPSFDPRNLNAATATQQATRTGRIT